MVLVLAAVGVTRREGSQYSSAMTTPVGRKTVATPGVQRAPVAAAKVETQAPAAAPSKGWTMKAPGARAVAAPVAAPGASALSDKATRLKLAQVPQENAISGLAKNGNRVCGGAAVVGALIMRSGTTEGAQANSRALSDALFKSGADRFLPDSVNHDALKLAFERFGAGNPNAGDVALLQQAAYAVGCKFAGGDKGDGLSGGQLAGLVADLKTRGATLGPETRFVQVHDGVGGQGFSFRVSRLQLHTRKPHLWAFDTPQKLVRHPVKSQNDCVSAVSF